MTARRCVLAATASAALLLAASAQAAQATTIRLFSSPISSSVFDPNGNPVGSNQMPPPGSTFIATDADFRGTHASHSRRPVGYDHVVCTIIDPAAGSARCDALIALRGGLIISDRQSVSFSAPSQVFNITEGTGRYRRAKGGTVTATSPSQNSSASDLVVRY